MAVIGINDNIMMILFFYHWLLTVVEIHESFSMGCKIESFLAMFSLPNATFQVVAMTLDKFVAIKWPHKAATYSTPKRAKLVVVAILFCVTIYNIPHLFISKLIGKSCVSYGAGDVYTQVYSWFTFALNGIVSFISLIAMNVTIIHSVRKGHKRFSNGQKPVENLEDQHSASRTKQRLSKNTENQLTAMLLLVTTLFLVLLIPTYIRFLYFNYVKRDTPEEYASSMLFYYLCTRLYFTHSGINFFLYCISGRKFRGDLKELFSCGRNCTSKRIIKDHFSSTVTSYTGRSETIVSRPCEVNNYCYCCTFTLYPDHDKQFLIQCQFISGRNAIYIDETITFC